MEGVDEIDGVDEVEGVDEIDGVDEVDKVVQTPIIQPAIKLSNHRPTPTLPLRPYSGLFQQRTS